MGTIGFLISVGVIAFAVVWLTRRSSRTHELQKKTFQQSSQKLTPTSNDRLSRREEIWEARREFAEKNINPSQRFVPKSVAAAEPEYDGYSRRDRHHLATVGLVKKDFRGEEKTKSP